MSLLSFMRLQLNYHLMGLVVYTFLVTFLVVLGYVVAPILFANLSSKMAGYIAGLLFNIGGYISVLLLFMLFIWHYVLKLGVKLIWPNVLAMSIMMVLLWLISPWMAEVKALYPLGLDKGTSEWPLFASLHGIYQLGYLTVIVLLVVAMWRSIKSIRLSVRK